MLDTNISLPNELTNEGVKQQLANDILKVYNAQLFTF